MKSTGVIRRIDELGRIVIPKEIRRNLKIRDGESMEIFIDMDSIILKKYSRIEDSTGYAKKLCTTLHNLTNNEIIITDRERIISAEGENLKNLENETLSKQLTNIIDNRETYFASNETTIDITATQKLKGFISIVSIIVSADSVGLVIINNKNNLVEETKTLAKFISNLISTQIDVAWKKSRLMLLYKRILQLKEREINIFITEKFR